MSIPDVLFYLLIFVAIVGVCFALTIGKRWRSIGNAIGDTWIKTTVETVQILSASVGIGSAFAAQHEKPEWLRPAIAGAVSLGVWKLLQVLADNRIKAVDKFSKEELARAKQQATFWLCLVSFLRRPLMRKIGRIQKEVKARKAKLNIHQVRKGLSPNSHIEDLLDCLGLFLREQLPEPDRHQKNFRISVYVEMEGIMTPICGRSLNDPTYLPLTSHDIHKERFRLAGHANPAYAVRCVDAKKTIIVEDCEKMAESGEFTYFSESQRSYLRSFVAHNLGEVCEGFGKITKAALTIDTDVTAFFKEADRPFLELCLREFESRLKLELLLHRLVHERGKS